MFTKILIANRGEIACRVIRTARQLGYPTVAVFSEADAQAPHVTLADEAVCIGGAAASESYLRADTIIDAAKQTGANAIHPGYGFLSENAGFAQACADAGLIFIGPPPEAIRVMGDKAGAKRRMIAAGVPCAPGYLGSNDEDGQSDAKLIEEAKKLGYPLLVKAVSGGGGRGMRLVHADGELQQAITSARREAQSAFGDGTLMLERLIENGRHIEIQVFADTHGNAVYIGERDCSSQRRRQKVIEEAPSPIVSPAMRASMGQDAVNAALAIGYRGAGTIEFIVDQDLNYYFLEMNTRLQVEHPVTELISGQDLVAWQLRVAAGEPLPLKQSEIQLQGHAIELRLYAEDPYAGFAPQTGAISWWRPERAVQDGKQGIRIDDGIREGGSVTPYYDPMVAKLIAHGKDRDEAMRCAIKALDAAPLLGLRNNARFLRDLLDCEPFRTGRMHTALIDAWGEQQAKGEATILAAPKPATADWLAAAAVHALQGRADLNAPLLRSASVAAYDLTLECAGAKRRLRVEAGRGGLVRLQLEGEAQAHTLRVTQFEGAAGVGRGDLGFELDGTHHRVLAVWIGHALHLNVQATTFVFTEASPWPNQDQATDPRRAVAPTAGVVAQVLVKPGDAVKAGQMLISVEAMKMEMWLCAQADGIVKAVHGTVGLQVQALALLAEIEITEATTDGSSTPAGAATH